MFDWRVHDFAGVVVEWCQFIILMLDCPRHPGLGDFNFGAPVALILKLPVVFFAGQQEVESTVTTSAHKIS